MLKTCLVLALLLSQATIAVAQAPVSRERELLRRTQAALRDVTGERDALRASEAALRLELEQARDAARAAAGTLDAVEPQLARARQDAQALRAEIDALRRQHAQALERVQQEAAAREASLRQALAARTAESEERLAANRRVTTLLEAAQTALRDAQRRNAELAALGLELVDQWRHKTPAEAWSDTESVVGIAGVRAEDRAERWRTRIGELALPQAPAR